MNQLMLVSVFDTKRKTNFYEQKVESLLRMNRLALFWPSLCSPFPPKKNSSHLRVASAIKIALDEFHSREISFPWQNSVDINP